MYTLGQRFKTALKMKGFKKQKEAATIIGISKGYLSELLNDKKSPSELLFTIIEIKLGISPEWLKEGKKPIFIEDNKRPKMPPLYEPSTITGEPLLKKEEKPLIAAEESAIYETKEDRELAEIIQILKEHPQDKGLILKLLKGKKDIKEALEGFEIKKLLEGEE